METIIIDGIEYKDLNREGIKHPNPYYLKIVSCMDFDSYINHFIWFNLPGFEMYGVKMDYKELESFRSILKHYGYIELQKLTPVKKEISQFKHIEIISYTTNNQL